MKRTISFILAFLLIFTMLTACTDGNGPIELSEYPTTGEPEASVDDTPTTTPEETSAPEEATTPEEVQESDTPTPAQGGTAGSSDIASGALDATPFDTKENAVPLGTWVYIQKSNPMNSEIEPFYIRIVGVNRDPDAVQAAIDSYTGMWDLSLTEDQARDIEFAIAEYEIHFAPEYSAHDWGITVPSMSFSATPIESNTFKTKGGMTYIGVGSMYNLRENSSENPHPGDTIRERCVFSVLKDCDESEYVFKTTWYDGEIETENARDLFLAAG